MFQVVIRSYRDEAEDIRVKGETPRDVLAATADVIQGFQRQRSPASWLLLRAHLESKNRLDEEDTLTFSAGRPPTLQKNLQYTSSTLTIGCNMAAVRFGKGDVGVLTVDVSACLNLKSPAARVPTAVSYVERTNS